MDVKFQKWTLCLIGILALIIPNIGKSQQCNISFKRLSIEQGLASGFINEIQTDQHGFLWLATQEGLSRYDGVEILNLQKTPEDSSSLKLDEVISFTLWKNASAIATDGSGNLMHVNLNSFVSKIIGQESDASGKITKLLAYDNQVLVATENAGLRIFNPENREFKNLMPFEKTGRISNLKMDYLGIVWLITDKGLFIMKSEQSFVKVHGSESYGVIDMSFDKTGKYWGVSRSGIFSVNAQLDVRFINKEEIPFEFSQVTTIHSIDNYVLLLGKYNNMWAYDKRKGNFLECVDLQGNYSYYSEISAKYKDNAGTLWMGTDGDGLIFFNPASVFGTFQSLVDKNRPYYSSISITADKDNHVYSLSNKEIYHHDVHGDLIERLSLKPFQSGGELNPNSIVQLEGMFLIGTVSNGLFKFSAKGEFMANFHHTDNSSISLPSDKITKLATLFQQVWVATSNGVASLDIYSGVAKRYFYEENDLSNTFNLSIVQNQLWVWGKDQLYKYNPDKQEFDAIEIKVEKTEFRMSDINCITEVDNQIFMGSKHHGLWLGLTEGANKVHIVSSISVIDGLTHKWITGLVPDLKKNLWISTKSGLNRYSTNEKTLFNYHTADGIASTEFNNSLIRLSNGSLVASTRRGSIVFNPEKVPVNFTPIRLEITGIKAGNLNYKKSGDPGRIDSLDVGYFNRNITVSFAALDFLNPTAVNYAYRLKGLNDNWVELGNTNFITFTDLAPKRYLLEIKAMDSHGVNAENEKHLVLNIIPPFYENIWFRISLVALIIAIALSIYYYRVITVRKRNLELEKEVSKRTEILRQQNIELAVAKQKAQASDKAKSDFMATVSHEMRTPMNGLLGSVGIMGQTDLNMEQREYLNTISECGDNMMSIINEILDYSKIETGKLVAEKVEFNLISALETTVDLFRNRALSKKIDLACYIHPNVPKRIRSDKSRINQLMNNLLSNAIKFTQEGGVMVEVSASEFSSQDGHCTLNVSIKDTGIGVPKDKHSEIFDAFTQVDTSSTREFGGTGLGLAICRSIVNILGGKITLDSEPGKGSNFLFSINVAFVDEPQKAKSKAENQRLIIIEPFEQTRYCLNKLANDLAIPITVLNSDQELASIADGVKPVIFIEDSIYQKADWELLRSMASELIILNNSLLPEDNFSLLHNEKILHKPIRRDDFRKIFLKEEPQTNEVVEIAMEVNKNIHILLAEDNKVNQMVTRKIFSKLGFNIDIAENGKIALDMCKQKHYDLVLMDLLMPEMDGQTATIEIRKQVSKDMQPFITAFSANIFNQDRDNYRRQGFNEVLSKPAKMEDIARIIELSNDRKQS